MSDRARRGILARRACDVAGRRRTSQQRGVSYALLFATMLAAMAAPGAAVAQSCTGQCLFDRLWLPVTAPAVDQTSPTGKPADREASPPSWSLSRPGSIGSAPRWTVSAEAIVLTRTGSVNQALVGRVSGDTQWLDTNVPGVEALNSNQFTGVAAGPKVSLTYRADSGISVELSYFNIFDQGASKTIGPDNPANWLVMQAPGAFWQTQDFAYQGMTWVSTTNLYSAEANGRLDLSGKVTVLAGFRWLQLDDALQGTLSPPDQMVPDWKLTCWVPYPPQCKLSQIGTGTTPTGPYPPFWTTNTINNLYGVQIGVDAKMLEFGRFSVDGQVKAGLFDNHATQSAWVSMSKKMYAAQATTDHAAFVGEFGLQLKYQVAAGLAAKVGYRALWFAGVALAPGQIQETLTTSSSVTAMGVNCGSRALFQGATAGLEYSF
jgi:hypothetical protein